MIEVSFVVISYVLGLMTYQDALDECQKTDDPIQCVVQVNNSKDYYVEEE